MATHTNPLGLSKLRTDYYKLFSSFIDVADGGAEHFARTVSILKERYNLLVVIGCLLTWGSIVTLTIFIKEPSDLGGVPDP